MAKALDDCDLCQKSYFCDASKLKKCNVAEEPTPVIDDSACRPGYLVDTENNNKECAPCENWFRHSQLCTRQEATECDADSVLVEGKCYDCRDRYYSSKFDEIYPLEINLNDDSRIVQDIYQFYSG
jgi:hypothetical protein